jgi:hypothetical protein
MIDLRNEMTELIDLITKLILIQQLIRQLPFLRNMNKSLCLVVTCNHTATFSLF